MESKNKVYDIVNEKILEQLEKGVIPWRKPWNSAQERPRNIISGKVYRGINAFLLAVDNRFSSPYWMTYKQAEDLKGYVKKGEKGTMVIFWKLYEKENQETQKKESIPVLRYYTVFNLEQCEGITAPKDENAAQKLEFEPIQEAEKLVNGYVLHPTITHSGTRAFYRPSTDEIYMPAKEDFKGIEEYYSTLFHELTHSTGHERRLNREGIAGDHSFGDEGYSKEELIAEFGAAFLCGISGIENTLTNSAAYIQNWMNAIKANKTWLVHAAAAAQKAADYIQGVNQKEEV